MLKKIVLAIFLFFSFGFAEEKTDYDLVETVLKDGKYYIKGTEKLYSGYIEYISNKTGKVALEEDYKDGVIVQERQYYESGALKSIKRYADSEPFLEEKFFEDGTLCERKFHKDGSAKFVYIKNDDSEEIYTPEGRTKIYHGINGMIFKQDTKRDVFEKVTELYDKKYEKTELTEKNSTDDFSFSRKWKYGILVNESVYTYKENGETTGKITSCNKDNILKVEEKNSTKEYFPNGNKKYEDIVFWDKEGKKHYERRNYDESGKMLSEEIEISSETIKSDLENYKKYYEMTEGDKPYKILYPNGKTAYEKYFTNKNTKMEKYYTKEGVLVFEQETYPEPYKIKIKYSFLESWDEYKGKIERDIKIVKRYTPEGKPVYIENFKDTKEYTIFEKTSYHKNGKIYYHEKETINKKNIASIGVIYELKRYNDKGSLEYFLTFDGQKRDEKHYDKKGNLCYETVIENEKGIVGYEKETNISYYKNGKIRKENITEWNGYYIDILSEVEKTYSINGDLKEEHKK